MARAGGRGARAVARARGRPACLGVVRIDRQRTNVLLRSFAAGFPGGRGGGIALWLDDPMADAGADRTRPARGREDESHALHRVASARGSRLRAGRARPARGGGPAGALRGQSGGVARAATPRRSGQSSPAGRRLHDRAPTPPRGVFPAGGGGTRLPRPAPRPHRRNRKQLSAARRGPARWTVCAEADRPASARAAALVTRADLPVGHLRSRRPRRPMKVLLAHPGTQHARQLAVQLERHGLLGELWTGLAFAADSLAGRSALAASRLPKLGGLASRVVDGIPAAKIRRVAINELRALARLRREESLTVVHERNAVFQQAIPDATLTSTDATIGFDTSSWILAERLARLERPLFLDRSIAHPAAHERIMRDVAARFPDWAAGVGPRLPNVMAAEQREHTLAHRIVVGSPFVARTLHEAGVAAEKIRVNPYGVDWERFAASASNPPAGARPRRFLFVGSVIARKGVPLLLKAWRALQPRGAELWIVGRTSEHTRTLIPELPGLKLLGQITGAQMPAIYAQCDVLVLPTFFEGFSLVVLEALAAGLPVITTPNSGAETILLRPGLGQIIPIGDLDALVEAMRRALENSPPRADVVRATQALHAEFSWSAYGDRWAALLTEQS
ncbi:MAG: hypothetical protein C0518_09255 [Opitutus sp.]|nr:hypothetical protein [Opitutus sp.]